MYTGYWYIYSWDILCYRKYKNNSNIKLVRLQFGIIT